jgi:hypothetical protein
MNANSRRRYESWFNYIGHLQLRCILVLVCAHYQFD